MPAERRGQAIAFEIGSTGDGRNPMFNGRRQPSCGGTSRMMREYQVRICERLGVKFPGPTRPSQLCRTMQPSVEIASVSRLILTNDLDTADCLCSCANIRP